tara:strand:+ start:13660 stop:14082 length:423 start_codon:yes stop_codon:yes gene_type:complete
MAFCTAEDITNALPLGTQDISAKLGTINLTTLIDDVSNYITSKLSSRYTDLVEGNGLLKQICIGLTFQKVTQFLNNSQLDGLKEANLVSVIDDAKQDLQALVDGTLTLPTTAYTSNTSTMRLNAGFTSYTDEELTAKRML